MFRAKLFLLPVCLLQAILMIEDSNCEAAEKKAVVFGTPAANLRSGAGFEHQIKATLKEGDQVTVEKLEGEWYQVTVADGQTGFVHKSLLKFADEASPSASSSAASQAAPAPNPIASTRTSKPTASAKAPSSKDSSSATAGKSPSVLQMMEGHENEVMIAAAVGAACFIIGWVLGGHYYLRRDRSRRRRIQF
jgi:uncharacterized protein YgiM (DUF1202 family)